MKHKIWLYIILFTSFGIIIYNHFIFNPSANEGLILTELNDLQKQAKNGVRVHSGKKYLLEFKLDQKVYCKDTITFDKQEQKIVKCNISD